MMNFLVYLTLLLSLLSSCAGGFKARSERFLCADGNVVIIPKYDPFKFYEDDRKKTLEVLFEIKNNKIIISGNDSSRFRILVEKLDQVTTQSLISAKVAWETFKMHACDKQAQTNYLEMIKSFMSQQVEIQTLRLKIIAMTKANLSGNNVEGIIITLEDFIKKHQHI